MKINSVSNISVWKFSESEERFPVIIHTFFRKFSASRSLNY